MRNLPSLTEERSARYTWDAIHTLGNIPVPPNQPQTSRIDPPQSRQAALTAPTHLPRHSINRARKARHPDPRQRHSKSKLLKTLYFMRYAFSRYLPWDDD